MATKQISTYTVAGNIADADQLLGQRPNGTTVLLTFNGVIYDADFSSNGIMTRTASGTYTSRTLTGTSNSITVTNGDGVSGNPTFAVASGYAGGTSITTLGTVGTGTWQATVIGLTYGGTGAALTASNGGIVYSNASTLAVLAGTATANKILLSGSSTTPVWSTPTFPNASATLNKRIKSDGTNWVASTTTMPDSGTSRKMVVGDGTNYVESTETWAVPGSSGNVLRSDGTNWVAGKAVLTTDVTGVLPVANGGTNASSASITAFNNITGYSAAGATGTTSTNVVFSTSPTITTPVLNGFTDASAAAAGVVGQTLKTSLDSATPTSTVASNITSISLTAGDWDIWGAASYNAGGSVAYCFVALSLTSATITIPVSSEATSSLCNVVQGSAFGSSQTSTLSVSISSTTTYYLVINSQFTSTLDVKGMIFARRRR